ncbi:MAG: hypothetical protein AAGH46_13210, partial [Bacteroidota bacterium]
MMSGNMANPNASQKKLMTYDRKMSLIFCSSCKKFVFPGSINEEDGKGSGEGENHCTEKYRYESGSIARHLRQTHQYENMDASREEKEVLYAIKSCPELSKTELSTRNAYMKYYLGKTGNVVGWNEVLPAVEGLQNKLVYQCNGCFMIHANKAKASSHKKKCKSEFT